MSITNRLKNQHLLWRAGFGPMAENTASLQHISPQKLWQLLVKTSAKKPQKIAIASGLGDGLVKGIQTLGQMENAAQKLEQAKKRRAQSRDELRSMNIRWLDEMIHSQAQLREKLSLFWHGHFAARVINSYFQQELLHSIRTNALENFGDLLFAVSKSPTMLQFLNNQQNRKASPNENFAREVMELFTMGRGNYTEKDIKEAARAFTGWGYNANGEFVFRARQHDTGKKTFLGQTGNFDGDDILQILLQQKQTAFFITQKLYRYLVNENEPDEANIQWLSERFYNSGYQINKLLEDIFTSEWFFHEKNIGVQIKSPIELLAGIRRFLPLEMVDDNLQLLYQKVLGQILFYPPNVAGWPGGKSWIDSSTLMVRLQIPQVLGAREILQIRAKTDDDVAMGQMNEMEVKVKKGKINQSNKSVAEINWKPVEKAFGQVKRENLLDEVAMALLQTNQKPDDKLYQQYLNHSNRPAFIQSAVIYLMSTPEYQVC